MRDGFASLEGTGAVETRVLGLAPLAGWPFRIRFYLDYGVLFSYGLTDDETDTSGGYVADGGPGLTGDKDRVGQ